VIANDEDWDQMMELLKRRTFLCNILISPCISGSINSNARTIAERIIKENLNDVRYSLQVHKVLWKNKRGV
jgi:hypothetical protein